MDSPNTDEELRDELDRLRGEHRALDERIEQLADALAADQLEMRRLKKTKLKLKDQIARIEDQLYPDIIA